MILINLNQEVRFVKNCHFFGSDIFAIISYIEWSLLCPLFSSHFSFLNLRSNNCCLSPQAFFGAFWPSYPMNPIIFAVSRSRPGVNPRPRIPLLNGKSSDTQRLSVRPQNKKGVKDPQVSQTVKIKSENVNECQISTCRRTKKQYLLLELNIKPFLKK